MIIETCTLLVLLFGCENWILSGKCYSELESFKGEIAKRALKWPKHFSNTATLVTLDMPTTRCHIFHRVIFQRKQKNFLRRLMTPEALEFDKTFADDIEDLCLVKECRELGSMFNSDFTTKVLTDYCNQREMKSIIQSLDKEATLEKCTSMAPPKCSSCH